MSPPPEKKKFAKNVSDSRTYFSSAQSSGSAEVRVNVAVMWQICAICAVLGGDLRIIRLCSDCSLTPLLALPPHPPPHTPSSPVAFSGAGYCKVATSVTFLRLMKPERPARKKPQTLQKNPKLLNCATVCKSIAATVGDLSEKVRKSNGITFVM